MQVPPLGRPREVARSIGRGVRTVGRGAYEVGAGLVEGLGIPRPTLRGAGRVTGEAIREAGQIAFRDPDYFWGDWERPRKREQLPRKPASRLPVETQAAIIRELGELHPNIYNRLWYRGITYSEFIGSLRTYFPDIYEEVRDYAEAYYERGLQREPYYQEEPTYEPPF